MRNTYERSNELLFRWIYNHVIESGGDGDAVVGFQDQNYKDVAEEWWHRYFPRGWERTDTENWITFHRDQEFIIVTDKLYYDEIQCSGQRVLTY